MRHKRAVVLGARVALLVDPRGDIVVHLRDPRALVVADQIADTRAALARDERCCPVRLCPDRFTTPGEIGSELMHTASPIFVPLGRGAEERDREVQFATGDGLIAVDGETGGILGVEDEGNHRHPASISKITCRPTPGR